MVSLTITSRKIVQAKKARSAVRIISKCSFDPMHENDSSAHNLPPQQDLHTGEGDS